MSDLDPRSVEEITRLIKDGKKIEAIKVMREVAVIGLAEAKEAVEALERGESPGQRGRRSTGSDDRATGRGLPAKVQGLLRRGEVVEAIKEMRQSTGLGLKEAKAEVDAFLDKHPELARMNRSGAGKPIVIIIVIVLLGAGWYVARMLGTGG